MRRRAKIIPFPGPRRASRAPADHALTEVHRCDQPEALVVKSLFESEGIPTLLRSHLVTSLHPFSVGDQGQVAVLVPGSQVDRCRALLIRIVRRPNSP